MGFWARIKAFGPWSLAQRDRDLEREIRNHLEIETEESGKHTAQRLFGNDALVREDVRAAWGWTRFEQFWSDVRYGLRQLRRSPAFSAIAITTLALGIGVNTAIFSAVDAVLIRPLPYTDADRLVMIWDDMSNIGFPKHLSTPAEWREWRRSNTVFTDIADTESGPATLSGEGEPEQVPGRKVTGNLWSVLGVRPLFGRVFTEDEDIRGARVAVISFGLWQRRYGGARDILGRKITLNDASYEVIGVMPREFYFLPARDIDIWMPASFSAEHLRMFGWNDEQLVARLKPGVTLNEARESMRALSLRVTAHFNPPRAAVVVPLREELAGKAQSSLIVLLGAAGAVLLIACVNLANLLLARGAARRREVAVRAALGAGRRRLAAQFLTESMVLSLSGAIAGLLVAAPVMRFLESLVPPTMAAIRLTLDSRALAFSLIVAITAGLTFGLVPALGGTRLDLLAGLREGGRGTSGARSHRLQHSLVVMETALAVVLLTSGGLLVETFRSLRRLDLGIRTENLLTLETPLFRYREFDRRVAFVNAEVEKIRAIPGVVSAGAISKIPLTEIAGTTRYVFAGQSNDAARAQDALSRVVTRDYFSTIGARLREGRFFDISDRLSDSPVAIVNESFADRNFPGRSALGARFQFGCAGGPRCYWYTIVGVVREIRERGVAQELKPSIYRVHEQANQTGDAPSGIVVRTAVDAASIVPVVRRAIWSVDKTEPVTHVQTVEDIVAKQLSAPSQNTSLLSAFALLALVLASLGLYGVLSHGVVHRTNEIGVRMALGATSNRILLSFGGRGLALTIAGLVIGFGLSAISARLLTTMLYGFRPDYVPIAAAVSAVLISVATLACFIPARRASRIDPTVALRHE
jgi:putative ABC transport system permease protein